VEIIVLFAILNAIVSNAGTIFIYVYFGSYVRVSLLLKAKPGLCCLTGEAKLPGK